MAWKISLREKPCRPGICQSVFASKTPDPVGSGAWAQALPRGCPGQDKSEGQSRQSVSRGDTTVRKTLLGGGSGDVEKGLEIAYALDTLGGGGGGREVMCGLSPPAHILSVLLSPCFCPRVSVGVSVDNTWHQGSNMSFFSHLLVSTVLVWMALAPSSRGSSY